MAPRVYNYRDSDDWKVHGLCAPEPTPDPPEWLHLDVPSTQKWRNEWAIAEQARVWSVFFPDSKMYADEAKAICRNCPVQVRCLTFALQTRQDFGVWGGLTENERKRLLKRRTRQARRDLAATAAS